MGDHHCLGFRGCLDHPRWHVWRCEAGLWWVNAPGTPTFDGHISLHPTHAEAIIHAQKEATK